MLVLTRKLNEQIRIGDDVTITLVRINGNSVRIGIEAPRSVNIARGELASIEPEESEESEADSLQVVATQSTDRTHRDVRPASGQRLRIDTCGGARQGTANRTLASLVAARNRMERNCVERRRVS